MTSWSAAEVKCPYYRKDDKETIYCEGITSGCKLSLSFLSKKEKQCHMDNFCADTYRYCELYIAISLQYND